MVKYIMLGCDDMARKSNKRKRMICQKIGKILSVAWIIISLAFFIMLSQIHILPGKYMMILLGIYAFITLIVFVLMLNPKINLKTKMSSEIFSTIFLGILLLVCSYLYKTIDFMGNIKDKKYQIENYYVIVLENSHYEKIKDLKEKEIGIYASTLDTQKESLQLLEKKITYQEKTYKDMIALSEDLMAEKIDAIYINASYLSIISDYDETFESKIKIIETIEIKIKNETVKKDLDVTKESFNLYISGIDVYGNIASVSRSDVNMIVTVNPITHKILLTSIPRDYYVRLHGTTGYRDKLTHAGIYGVDMSIATIEDLLEIDINYYARVNFTTLVDLVDAIGGIDVYSDYQFVTIHGGYEYQKGINHLNGAQALSFSRERYAFATGDIQRGKNQQAVIKAIINKALSSKTMITKYTSILNSIQDSFQTNMGSNKIYDLVNMQLDKMPSWTIETISLGGTGKSEYTYSYTGGRSYVMEPDWDTVNDAQEKIKNIMQEN